jgi:hypothetical protein
MHAPAAAHATWLMQQGLAQPPPTPPARARKPCAGAAAAAGGARRARALPPGPSAAGESLHCI